VVVGLAAFAVALAAWVVPDEEANAPGGVASPEITTMLDDRMAALNWDGRSAAAFYSADAVLEERDVVPAVITTGRATIAARLQALNALGLQLISLSEPIQLGPYVAEAASWGDGSGGILVYQLDQDGKITHQWVIGGEYPYQALDSSE
jgi:hypothetical protein